MFGGIHKKNLIFFRNIIICRKFCNRLLHKVIFFVRKSFKNKKFKKNKNFKHIGYTILVFLLILTGFSRLLLNFLRTEKVQAAASFVSCGAATIVASGDMVSVAIPAGIHNDDILIAFIHTRDNTDSTMPAGWTSKIQGNGNSNNRLEVFWKRVNGTESNPTISHSGSGGNDAGIARICAFRGIETYGDPFDSLGVIQSNTAGESSPISTAGITTSVDGALIMHIFGSQDDNIWGNFTGSAITQIFQTANNQSGNNDHSLALTYNVKESSGTTGVAGATQVSG